MINDISNSKYEYLLIISISKLLGQNDCIDLSSDTTIRGSSVKSTPNKPKAVKDTKVASKDKLHSVPVKVEKIPAKVEKATNVSTLQKGQFMLLSFFSFTDFFFLYFV